MKPNEIVLLRSLLDEGVRFVVIGAFAFPAHGFVRDTRDVDILFEPTLENLGRLRRALRALRYPEWEVTDEAFLTKKILFRGFQPEIDTHPSAAGAEWALVWNRRVVERIEDLDVPCAGLDDLIAMKRAAGRLKDLQDLEYLQEIQRRKASAGAPDAAPGDPPPDSTGPSPGS